MWKLKTDPDHMVIFSANMDKENEDGWDFVTEFYVFKTDVGYDTKPYSVSKDQGPKSRSSEVNRIIQEGRDVEGNDHLFNFWAFSNWQPGLKV